MNDKDKIRELVALIVSEEIREEQPSYQFIENFAVQKLFEEENSLDKLVTSESGHNEFLKELGEIITSLSVLAGTIKTYLDIRQQLKKNKEARIDDLRQQWEKDLIANGLTHKKAEFLSNKYCENFKKIIS